MYRVRISVHTVPTQREVARNYHLNCPSIVIAVHVAVKFAIFALFCYSRCACIYACFRNDRGGISAVEYIYI